MQAAIFMGEIAVDFGHARTLGYRIFRQAAEATELACPRLVGLMRADARDRRRMARPGAGSGNDRCSLQTGSSRSHLRRRGQTAASKSGPLTFVPNEPVVPHLSCGDRLSRLVVSTKCHRMRRPRPCGRTPSVALLTWCAAFGAAPACAKIRCDLTQVRHDYETRGISLFDPISSARKHHLLLGSFSPSGDVLMQLWSAPGQRVRDHAMAAAYLRVNCYDAKEFLASGHAVPVGYAGRRRAVDAVEGGARGYAATSSPPSGEHGPGL